MEIPSSVGGGLTGEQLEEITEDILARAGDAVDDKLDEVFTSISSMEIKLKKLIEKANEQAEGTIVRVDKIEEDVKKL